MTEKYNLLKCSNQEVLLDLNKFSRYFRNWCEMSHGTTNNLFIWTRSSGDNAAA